MSLHLFLERMEIHLKIIGILQILLALFHIGFYKYFNWKTELQLLSQINREIMIVHTFFIALMVLLLGMLSFFAADQLISNSLGKLISVGIGVFWGIRLVIQWWGYSATLWKGKPRETLLHVLFTLLWIYFSGIYLCIALL